MVLVYSSFLSLIVGTVLGLNQSRIKRLFAYSTISHLGFILLALSINSVESIQAFIFYLMQYSVSNLNAFMLLIAIGYSLYIYTDKNSEKNIYVDKNNSPIQYTNQLKGYFDINPILAISFAITIFSFVGIPPLVGFFAKQMVLSAALNEGYVFITIIAILTSVISAVYYLGIIKQIFFDKSDYTFNGYLNHYSYVNYIKTQTQIQAITNSDRWCVLNKQNIVLSSSLSIIISILTLMISLFMFNSEELLSLVNTFTLLRLNL
ncbi:MAG: hypothetical protein EOP34_00195 [Rickettsiales bacterium]|nr:MAG: hypothetical protein EOP34_00195 [Rickettsiales bacterium]